MNKSKLLCILLATMLITSACQSSQSFDGIIEDKTLSTDFSDTQANTTQKVLIGNFYSAELPNDAVIKEVNQQYDGVPNGILAESKSYEMICYFRKATVFDFNPKTEWESLSANPEWVETFLFTWFDSDTKPENVKIIQSLNQDVLGHKTFIYEYFPYTDATEKKVLSISYIEDDLFFVSKLEGQKNDSTLLDITLNMLNSLEHVGK